MLTFFFAIKKAIKRTVVKLGYDTWGLRNTENDLLDVFQRNYLRILLGIRLTDRISNSNLCEKNIVQSCVLEL